jgi:SAM-dependent methyltransferase
MTGTPNPSSDTLTDVLRASYDVLPYDNLPRYGTHPDCMATAAHLRGLKVAPLRTARVLELGCSTGVNLIAQAITLPEAQFSGIDLSSKQIDAARTLSNQLGLANVRFEAADLRVIARSLGEFDYIICHGVYSHVPPDVQEAVLSICAGSLSPNGVACISFNTQPGWGMRGMVRDMLRRHVRDSSGLSQQVDQARNLMRALARHAQPADGWYARALAHEAAILEGAPDSYLAHEHLDPVNEALHLTDFVGRADGHGLRYVGEAIPEAPPPGLANEPGSPLAGLRDDALLRDQMLDYFTGRAFRRTVLCRSSATLHSGPPVERVRDLEVRALAVPVAERPSIRDVSDETFRTADGYAATSNDPLVKALLVVLRNGAPGTQRFATLFDAVRAMLAGAWPTCYTKDDPMPLAQALLMLHQGRMLRLQTLPYAFAKEAGDAPHASSLARAQAARGTQVTTLRHDMLELDDAERRLLVLLDGTRGRSDLLQAWAAGDASQLDAILSRMARQGLLVN